VKQKTDTRPLLLIVDDDEAIRNQMKWAFAGDYQLEFAWDSSSLLAGLERCTPAVVTLDLGLPPDPRNATEGLKLLREIHTRHPSAQVIVITGNPDKENALKAIDLGATDYYSKPVDLDELGVSIRRAVHIYQLETDLAHARDQETTAFGQMLGQSKAMGQVFHVIRRVAPSEEPVLIDGESGTGKELVARAVHQGSLRSKGPFVPVNCGAIPESLFEGELFGHEAGAFTDAKHSHKGLIERADGGTLFLDEIGEMPLPLQPKLLRFLQSGEVQRLGGRGERQVSVRVVSATNCNLEEMVREGRFREDLFYRVKVVGITLPPLAQRKADIPLLANHFLRVAEGQSGHGRLAFTDGVMEAMAQYPWPGNVRELENRIRSAAVMADNGLITLTDLQLSGATLRIKPLREARQEAERAHLEMALAAYNHNVTHTAKALEVSRPTLHAMINKLGIRLP
jgi:two-component system NtrC family response regulator